MTSARDRVLVSVAIAALAVVCFGAGWWVGRAEAVFERQDARIAALERQDARIAALEQGAVLAQARAVEAARPRPARGQPAAPRAHAQEGREARPAPVEVDVAGAPARGPADAPVTLVAFSDFECPFCARAAPTLERLSDAYGDRLRVVFKHFPLPMHARAFDAHKAAQAAAEQGAFWPMHDRIFANPQDLDAASLRRHAEALGLDLAAYDRAVASPGVEARIRSDVGQGQAAGVRGTPSFVVNGSVFSGALPFEAMKAHVDKALAEADRPPVARRPGAPAGAGR